MSMRLIILGGGESGLGAAILAKKVGHEVFLSDSQAISKEIRGMLIEHNVAFEENGHTESLLLDGDCVVKSPGIPDDIPLIKLLVKKGIPVISEIEFAYKYIVNAKIIAVTGTNGKSTTASLIYHLLNNAGYKVALGGNIGVSLSSLVAEGIYDYFVVEVSSFQLDGIVNFRADIAVLLNITPDHLDRYEHDFNNYIHSKFRIVENLTPKDTFVYSSDSEVINEKLEENECKANSLKVGLQSTKRRDAYVEKEHLIFNFVLSNRNIYEKIPLSDISLIGHHNLINCMTAVIASLCLQIPIEKIKEGLKSFKAISHRLEFVEEINGIRFINDSKATNVDAVYHALDGLDTNIVWIAGGIDKGNDYSKIEKLVAKKVKGMVCLGKENTHLTSCFSSKLPIVVESETAYEATIKAFEMAAEGDVVLLSPACSSFDLFKNYEDRGNQFRKAVKKLKEKLVSSYG